MIDVKFIVSDDGATGLVTLTGDDIPYTVIGLDRPQIDAWIDELVKLRDDMDRAGPHVEGNL